MFESSLTHSSDHPPSSEQHLADCGASAASVANAVTATTAIAAVEATDEIDIPELNYLLSPLEQLWILRLLIPMEGFTGFMEGHYGHFRKQVCRGLGFTLDAALLAVRADDAEDEDDLSLVRGLDSVEALTLDESNSVPESHDALYLTAADWQSPQRLRAKFIRRWRVLERGLRALSGGVGASGVAPPEAQRYLPLVFALDSVEGIDGLGSLDELNELGTSNDHGVLSGNLIRLARHLGLNPVEAGLLGFRAVLECSAQLSTISSLLGDLTLQQGMSVLAGLLGVSESSIALALSPTGKLRRSGLLQYGAYRHTVAELPRLFSTLPAGFAEGVLLRRASDPLSLFAEVVTKVTGSIVSLVDYPHLAPSIAVIRAYLQRAGASGRVGANILLHGAPGTGKTALSQALAVDLGWPLYEVARCAELEDEEMVVAERLKALRVAQALLAPSSSTVVPSLIVGNTPNTSTVVNTAAETSLIPPVLLLFDEVDDVLGSSFMSHSDAARKSILNALLETNPIPTIWIANRVNQVDPAFVRRFDVVLQVPVPPLPLRVSMLDRVAGAWATSDEISQWAECEQLAPAVMTRSAAVIEAVRSELQANTDVAMQPSARFAELLDETLRAQGQGSLIEPVPVFEGDGEDADDDAVMAFDPGLIRCSELSELETVVAGLQRCQYGRLCLYGPPGTGKSAFARYVARRLQRPLLVRRASDLLGAFVGETERRIAESFRMAKRYKAVLLIDEVDGFLMRRDHAEQAWVQRMTNEWLMQLERFTGIVLVTTNRMEALDEAAVRRFDLRLRFDYLQREASWDLFTKACVELEIPLPTDATDLQRLHTALAKLCCLTPGDFVSVMRGHLFRPLTGASALLSALHAACAYKADFKAKVKQIGFG